MLDSLISYQSFFAPLCMSIYLSILQLMAIQALTEEKIQTVDMHTNYIHILIFFQDLICS